MCSIYHYDHMNMEVVEVGRAVSLLQLVCKDLGNTGSSIRQANCLSEMTCCLCSSMWYCIFMVWLDVSRGAQTMAAQIDCGDFLAQSSLDACRESLAPMHCIALDTHQRWLAGGCSLRDAADHKSSHQWYSTIIGTERAS